MQTGVNGLVLQRPRDRTATCRLHGVRRKSNHVSAGVIINMQDLLLLLLLFTAIEFSLGGSSPYTSTDKTNKNKHT